MGAVAPTHVVHRLSEALGLPVITPGGHTLGRLTDVRITLGPDYPPIGAVTLRSGRGKTEREAAWTPGSHVGAQAITLAAAPSNPQDAATSGHELSLVRDVLDVQVVDVDRRRVGRVADIDLADVEGALRVVGVDIGLTGVMRRLGLGRFMGRLAPDMIDWRALHLAGGTAHAVQLRSPAAAVHRLDPADLAQVLMRVPTRAGAEILATANDVRAAAALAATHPSLGADLLETLSDARATALLTAMDAATAGAVMRQVVPSRREALLGALGEPHAQAVAEAMRRTEAPAPEPRARWWRVFRGHGRPAP